MEEPKTDQPLISLCLIVGNVQEYIERCLTSFKPIAAEICIVRAVGNQVPDETVSIARKLCAEWGVQFKDAYYRNKPAHQSWPHLDDFAAARNLSFKIATGKYLFWADSDDVFGEPGSDVTQMAEIVRGHAREGKYPIFMFPYKIFGRGITINRERMVRNGYAKWIYPVHECMECPDGTEGGQDDYVTIYHLPDTTKQGSNSRNLRILESIPDEELSPGLLYHLHGELVYQRDEEKAVETARRALESKDLGQPERYEIFLNLAKMAKDLDLARDYLHLAFKVDPRRRESLGLLTCNRLDAGKPEDGLAYAHAMMGLPRLEKPPWNDRPAAYDWLGVDIYTQALRQNGKRDAANRYAFEVLSHASKTAPIISLIHATRGRPKQASLARKVWTELAERPDALEHIFVFDEDDKDSYVLQRMNNCMVAAGGGCVNAWNMGAFQSGGQIIIQMSDDWMPPPRWDKLIVERFVRDHWDQSHFSNDKELFQIDNIREALERPRVLAISDGHRTDDLLCMAICTREYFRQDYFMFHPWFTGVYSDNWFTKVAYERKQVIEARDLVFNHNHPFFHGDGSPSSRSPRDEGVASPKFDETYQRQNSDEAYEYGLNTFNQLATGSDWSTVPGYFNYWAFYQTIAKTIEDGDTVAEIGVWMGRSIIMLAQELQRLGKRNVKLLAIDNFLGESNQREHQDTIDAMKSSGTTLRAEFERNIKRCGVESMIQILDGDSSTVAAGVSPASLAFCFIDAAHDYESVRRDILTWLPKMKQGHAIAGHDAQHPPVEKAVKERFPEATIIGPVWMAKA